MYSEILMRDFIEIIGAREHNLKNVNVRIPKNKLVVITGLSGSGKSSLAFDTLYAEGQRRYVESLSAYARQFLQLQNKPDVDSISGLSPSIAIDQRSISRNPRSTVGTITEIYDYLRLLYARIGVPYSPATGKPIEKQSASGIVEIIKTEYHNCKVHILAPIIRGQKGEHYKEFLKLRKRGFQRVKIDGLVHDLDDLPELDKNKKHDIEAIVDRLLIASDLSNRLAESVETALDLGEGIVKVEVLDEKNSKNNKILIFSEKFACPESGFQLEEIEPRTFSFNSPYGACPSCDGLGTEIHIDPNLVVQNHALTLNDGAIAPWESLKSRYNSDILVALSKHYKFSLDRPFKSLSEEAKKLILYGTGTEEIEISYTEGLYIKRIKRPFEGVIPSLERKLKDPAVESWVYEKLTKYQIKTHCQKCEGYRLKKEALLVKINTRHIGEITRMSIAECFVWFQGLHGALNQTHQIIASKIIKEVTDRLSFLENVGLDYLTLSRGADTLSNGESQRIRLASQIGSGLTGVLYVLDEPSIGLHQSDNDKLIHTLRNLAAIGNTVVVVEHDDETILAADYVIDVGPGAGIHGGHIVAIGTPKEITQNPASITGLYLSGKKCIPIPKKPRKGNGNFIELKGVTLNNLNNVSMKIALGTFSCVTGVSGSGKSSLTIHTFYKAVAHKLGQASEKPTGYQEILGVEYIDKVIDIDQSPIGRTPRSNPATYTGAFTYIRDWFTNLPESKARGYKVSRFSFNVKGGRCETCQGDGVLKIEMHFLPDVYVTCEECKGKRYSKETLEVMYSGKSISDVLELTVDDAAIFFAKIPSVKEKMDALVHVGLGYMKIGQSATTLSGGEAQRIKLAKELSRKSTGKTLYILDEPTTGLHIDDIAKLLNVLHKLVDLGNTVVVIEHNMDVIKTADYVVDVGPGGGNKGGKIVVAGTPYDIAKCPESMTGKYLKKYLYKTIQAD